MSVSLKDSAGIINATRVWGLIYNGLNITGKGETVCVIDSGVDYTHPAFGGCSSAAFTNGTCPRVIGGYDFVNNDNDSLDDFGHGTYVAGIVASNDSTYRGIAPDANIVAMKMLNSNGDGTTQNLISAIDWCTSNASKFNISVISMSLGVDGYSNSTYCDSSDQLTADAIHAAIGKNISVIVASGNGESINGVSDPACISNVTVVGSVSKSDSISSFSNRWGLPMLMAPGSSITSSKLGGGFITQSGTSAAAPHVAGAFALLRQYKRLEQNIILTPLQIQNPINSTGKIINDSSGSGLLYSRINIFSALLSLDTIAPNITLVAPTPANNSNISNSSFIINVTSNEVLSMLILEFNSSNETINATPIQLNWMINKSVSAFGVFNYRIYGNDSSGNMKITPTFQITINNTAPNITSFFPSGLNISIKEPNNLTFNITADDTNGDAIITRWYQNGTLVSSLNNFTFIGNFSSAGFYNITVIASDNNLGTSLSWNLTVNNTNVAPNITSVNLTNTDFLNRTNGTLQAFWSFNDFDGDNITANETLWYINNTLNTNYTNKTFIDAANTTKLENWIFSVRAFDGSDWSSFANSTTITILNAKPSLNINTTSIILSETQQVNITLSASDLDNDILSYAINDSRFFNYSYYFIWNTNLNDSGNYKLNITANDSTDFDSLLINLTINDAKDTDNDGNPDFNDTDKDNDGLDDATDYLIGNASTINTTIANLSILIGNSSNLSQIFNQSFTINFTLNNLTILSFDFNFTKGVDNISKTLAEKQSQTIVVNGKDYLVNPTFIDATRAKFIVNSETTSFLSAGDSYALSDGAIVGVTGINYQNFAGGIHSVDLYLSSKISSTLDLSKLTINRTTNGSSAIAIRGLALTNTTKTAFLEKINTTVKAVCIKDADAGFDEISSACDGTNEALLTCDNSTSGQYACFDTGTRYKITGLNHSAVKEECRDNDGDGYGIGCSLGNDCNDNDASKTTSCPSGGGSSGGGSGGGGGGGGSGGGGGGGTAGYVCNHDWKCSEWTACINGLQIRECNFVKVPQHVQDAQCPDESKIPAASLKCEVPKQLALSKETCDDGIKNQDETGIDCGGVCKPCVEGKNLSTQNIKQAETNLPTGFSVKNLFNQNSSLAITSIISLIVILIAFAGIKFYQKNRL